MTTFLGNYSVAGECMHRLKELMDLYETLGSLQQMGTGPNPVDIKIANQEYDKYEREASFFIRQLARDLLIEENWKLKLEKKKDAKPRIT